MRPQRRLSDGGAETAIGEFDVAQPAIVETRVESRCGAVSVFLKRRSVAWTTKIMTGNNPSAIERKPIDIEGPFS